jgi:hypothetical protein
LIHNFALLSHEVIDENCRNGDEQAVKTKKKDYLLHECEIEWSTFATMSKV